MNKLKSFLLFNKTYLTLIMLLRLTKEFFFPRDYEQESRDSPPVWTPEEAVLFVNTTCPKCKHITSHHFEIRDIYPHGFQSLLCHNKKCDNDNWVIVSAGEITKDGRIYLKVRGKRKGRTQVKYSFGCGMYERPDHRRYDRYDLEKICAGGRE